MQYTLRPYQSEGVDSGASFLLDQSIRDHGLMVEPTGSGKSLMIAYLVGELDAPAIVFQPSKELLEQNLGKFRDYGYQPSIYSASLRRKQVGEITLATIGTAWKHPEEFRDFRYVIIDEAHLVNPKAGIYEKFLNAMEPGVRILGLTASPYRLTNDAWGGAKLRFLTRTKPRIFSKMVHYTQNADLFRDGYLAKLEYHSLKFDKSLLQPNSTGAEFSDDSIRRAFKFCQFEDKIVNVVERLLTAGRRNVLVFTRFTEEAAYVAHRIPGAAIVTAETKPRERADTLSKFKSGAIKVVCNVNVLSIGFDFPELETVVLAAPTRSLERYYQRVGRCVRPHPLKDSAWVVDMVGTVEQFGKLETFELRDIGKRGELWALFSGSRQLTDVYFGEPNKSNTSRRRYFAKRNSGRDQ